MCESQALELQNMEVINYTRDHQLLGLSLRADVWRQCFCHSSHAGWYHRAEDIEGPKAGKRVSNAVQHQRFEKFRWGACSLGTWTYMSHPLGKATRTRSNPSLYEGAMMLSCSEKNMNYMSIHVIKVVSYTNNPELTG